MISFILIIAMVFIVARMVNKAQASQQAMQPVRVTCPPHSWSWQPVYNEDGSLKHNHIVCAKCGPLNGGRQ